MKVKMKLCKFKNTKNQNTINPQISPPPKKGPFQINFHTRTSRTGPTTEDDEDFDVDWSL